MFTIRRSLALAGIAAAVTGLFALSASTSSAHERRSVGPYVFVVGFLGEPALQYQPNGIDLRIASATTGDPVEGAERTLKADMIADGQTRTVEIRARFGLKGAYTADLIPTMAGTYTFRFHGTIDGTAVDERFTSGPGTFGNVQPASALQFPARVASPSDIELAAQVAQVAIAAVQIDNAQLHDLDTALAAGRIPGGALGRVRRVRVLVSATAWPAEMQARAGTFVEYARTVEAALEREDAAAAAPAAHELHEAGEGLSDAAFAWLAAVAGRRASAP